MIGDVRTGNGHAWAMQVEKWVVRLVRLGSGYGRVVCRPDRRARQQDGRKERWIDWNLAKAESKSHCTIRLSGNGNGMNGMMLN